MAQAFWQDLWTLLNTDIRQLGWDAAETGIEATQSLIDLAGTLNENRVALTQLTPVLEAAAPLIEALDSPLMAVVGGVLPFGSIGIGILKACLQRLQKDPTLSDCLIVVGQAAYLQSFQDILNQLDLSDDLKQTLGSLKLKTLMAAQSKQLKVLELDNHAAKGAIACFHQSPLAQALGEALQRQLPHTAAMVTLIERVARNTHWHLYQALAEAGEELKPLTELFRNGGTEKLEQEASIRRYLAQDIASQPQKQVFNEAQDGKTLSFAEIYVPMKVKAVDQQGQIIDGDAFDLETWATQTLTDSDNQRAKQVMFVQGEPGYGKSVFCRLYANWVRRQLYPSWIPILIRLRDVKLQPQFSDTLRQAIHCDFAANDEGWLTDTQTRFLFLLDGFDELVLSQQQGQGLATFLDNVARFQRDCASRPTEQGHRVLITGRPMALQGYEYYLPENLNRVAIQPMDDALQEQWLDRWQAYAGKTNVGKLRSLIQAEQCPEELQQLAREPLLLYLLAVLARSDELNPELFNETQGIAVKIQIYTRLIDFVLTQQRRHPDTDKNLNEALTRLKPKRLRRVLAELALCITQTETECASVAALKQRISEKAEREIDDLAQNNILAAFYLKQESQSGSIEFIHKSFREFLTAERLQRALEQWTEVRQDDYDEEEPVVPQAEFESQVYDFLGYGMLAPEILAYSIGLLQQQKKVDWGRLAQRLQRFYFRWADGCFIEQQTDTLPQQKARKLKQQGVEKGQRQVDIYTGLNVLILLFALHRYGQTLIDKPLKAQLSFHPCGLEGTNRWDRHRFLKIIHYTNSLGSPYFDSLLGPFLDGANLSGATLNGANLYKAQLCGANLSQTSLIRSNLERANLKDANLRDANLSKATLNNAFLQGADLNNTDLVDANLINAKLSGANLRNANLINANLINANLINANVCNSNLSGANLRNANLRNADLSGAGLSGADLQGTNLRNADLSGADLRGTNLLMANFFRANLDGIRWDDLTRWDSAYFLHKALKLQDDLLQNLSFASAFRLSQGYALAQAGNIKAALQAYDKAQKMNPSLFIEVRYWQQLCWHGCLHGEPAQVRFAGEKAVQLLGDRDRLESSCRESRGIARAMTNDLTGALADFQAAQRTGVYFSIVNHRRALDDASVQQKRWIAALEAGENPFTPAELAALRQAESASGDS